MRTPPVVSRTRSRPLRPASIRGNTMPLNDDPGAIPDEEYWSAFDRFRTEHPDFHEIPADQYSTYPTDDDKAA
jgi:hypothetical protein